MQFFKANIDPLEIEFGFSMKSIFSKGYSTLMMLS